VYFVQLSFWVFMDITLNDQESSVSLSAFFVPFTGTLSHIF
jgi:hypothetical protein